RHELVSTLHAALEKSLSGETRVVMLEGEPGIGKTRVVEELCREAAERGVTVLTGRCHEGEGAPAFWPWIQTMRDWMRLNQGKPIPDGLEAEAAFFTSWARGNMGKAAKPALEADAAEARFRAFDSAARGLQGFAKRTPLVLVLEDMHWADPASLGLLSFVGAELHHDPVLVLGTYRDRELHSTPELFQTLADLARQPTSRRLSIRGLEFDYVAQLLGQIVGSDMSPALAESVTALTEGNPFFVVEIARILGAEASVLESGDLGEGLEIELPASISDTVERRLGGLSADTRKFLNFAAVIGREFGTTLLLEAAGTERGLVSESLEEAATIGIIEPVQGSPDTYRFGHALIRETLYQGIRGPNQARLHRAIAEALERRHGESATPPLTALAHHWYQAVATGGVEKAAEYCERAGLQALSGLAFEEAAVHLKRALELADLHPSLDQAGRCELLLQLGQAEWGAGEHVSARSTFARAAALARQVGSAEGFARAAIGYYGFEHGITADAVTLALLEEAAGWIGADSPVLRTRVLSRLQHMMPHANRMETLRALSLEALDLGRACGDVEALGEAFRARANATQGPDTLDEKLEWEKECREWGERLGDPWLSWFGNDVMSPLTRGDRHGVLEALRHSARFARAMPSNRLVAFIGILQQSGFALMEGRFDDLRRHIEQIPDAGKNCVSWV
ncbi:MAG: AAA family ATPase, partial [bacterium]|nr:AAA family ATPase [bacterium]